MIHCDTPFFIYIINGRKTVAHLHAEETLKFWSSTIEDAVRKAKADIFKEGDKYHIYKKVDNLFEMYMSEIKSKGEPLAIVEFVGDVDNE